MILEGQKTNEVRRLLNPAFCVTLIWHAAQGYKAHNSGSLSFEECFLVLPFLLHKRTREDLPRSTSTSLAVWLNEKPLSRSKVVSNTKLLVPYTKEALLFGGAHDFIKLEDGYVHPNIEWKSTVTKTLKDSSNEVRECIKRATFIGKWFADTGNMATVLALIGVCP